MTTDAASVSAQPPPVISVRGEAQITVEPDQVVFNGQLNVLRPSTAEALQAAAVAVDTMKDALGAMGGVALDSTTTKAPLTWLVRRVHTSPEGNPVQGLTGNIYASVQWQIGLRDWTKLEQVQAVVADPHLHQVHGTFWQLDRDNPAWTVVRAHAVTDAFRRAQEYASALASKLLSLEHLADAGLLAGDGGGPAGRRTVAFAATGAPQRAPNLDPVPQDVSAVVEARFRIAPVDLGRLPLHV